MGFNIETKRIELDGDYDGGWVTVKRNVSLNKVLKFGDILKDADDPEVIRPYADEFLTKYLCAWNFEDKKEKALKCNSKNIKGLSLALKIVLMTNIIKGIISSPKAPETSSSSP